MRFCFLPTEPGPALWDSPNPNILAFPTSGTYHDPLPAVEALTYFPLQLTIGKAVEYWWRVYSFNLAYDIGDISGNLIATRTDAPMEEEVELCRGYSADAPAEKQARYQWFATENLGSGNSIQIAISMFPPDGFINAPDGPFVGPQYKMDLTNILPALCINIDALYFYGDSSIALTTANNLGPLNGSITFDGNALSCSYTDETGEPFVFTITPLQWYSYSGTWNTATGAKN